MSIWCIINSNISILMIGSGFGWLFVRFVYNPLKEKSELAKTKRNFQMEAFFRLYNLEQNINENPSQILANIKGGQIANNLNPAYCLWSLRGLIAHGWNIDKLFELESDISTILNFPIDQKNQEKFRKASNCLEKVSYSLKMNSLIKINYSTSLAEKGNA